MNYYNKRDEWNAILQWFQPRLLLLDFIKMNEIMWLLILLANNNNFRYITRTMSKEIFQPSIHNY